MQKNTLSAAIASTLATAANSPAAVPTEAKPYVGADLAEPLTEEQLEERVEALKPTAPRITKEHIQSLIVDETYTNLEGTRTTVCRLELANGFCVVGINNGPVSAANFDQQIGCEYAYKAAVDQIWPLEGYLLAERLFRAATEDEKVGKLRDLVGIQADPGNAGASEYHRGLANGLVLALSVFTGETPAFIDPAAAPEWSTHKANPVHVLARKIASVGSFNDEDGTPRATVQLVLEDGADVQLDAALCARYTPVAGDYLVRQEDGYEYLNPAAVFERKYSAVR